ncbi:PilW family protein [Clostridium lacusfryxellense]|uniref:PilW family protein n=1 Tax=Clostridium lacusfryxellense TaxID=205328 RepID=UPI001C0D848B|nr:type II secretion system protein [Clostridium lacusfryxellense]MBU3110252.1 type II secretion system GspH family protein [Clostridium lacusfryxellense]
MKVGNPMKKNFKKKGFTLVELIAVIAIMGIVFTIIFQIFDIQTKIYKTEMETNDAQNSGSLCLNSISESIRLASTVNDPNLILTPFSGVMKDAEEIVKISPYGGATPYRYAINDNKLYKYVDSSKYSLIASKVNKVTVTRLYPNDDVYAIYVEIVNGSSIKTFTTSMSRRDWR